MGIERLDLVSGLNVMELKYTVSLKVMNRPFEGLWVVGVRVKRFQIVGHLPESLILKDLKDESETLGKSRRGGSDGLVH